MSTETTAVPNEAPAAPAEVPTQPQPLKYGGLTFRKYKQPDTEAN